ncbi:MAG: hypothetical protein IKJ49_06745 [Bacteroidaceae bacterium]|nr:hypothetical protein [Bacteroidaceae bacterium]
MKNTILIRRDELQQQIDLRNFYMGESAKRKELNADTIQSSKDDEELLFMLARQACNELVTAVALRFPSISYSIDNSYVMLEFDTAGKSREHLLPILKQAVNDYIVNEMTLQWLLLREPKMAESYIALRSTLYDNVQMLFAKFYNSTRIRRRATDLAGI